VLAYYGMCLMCVYHVARGLEYCWAGFEGARLLTSLGDTLTPLPFSLLFASSRCPSAGRLW